MTRRENEQSCLMFGAEKFICESGRVSLSSLLLLEAFDQAGDKYLKSFELPRAADVARDKV